MQQCLFQIDFLCTQLSRLPQLSEQEWLSFVLGLLIVTFFAFDHYKVPTYAKTTIGQFIELSPQSLTSTQRYRKGLYIYVSLMLMLYLAFCFFWSNGLGAILQSMKIPIPTAQVWPIAAATAVTLVSTLDDKNPIGRLEAALRTMAHESAYIPDAVLHLSTALSESFNITPEIVRELGETNPEVLEKIRVKVGESQDGSLQTWVRAKYLASRLEVLRNEADFMQLASRPENVRAFDFLNEERQTLVERVSQRLNGNHADLDEPLKKKVESFRNAVAMFLASLLWQGCGSEIAIHKKAMRIRLPISPVEVEWSWNFLARVLGSLSGAALVGWGILHFSDWQWDWLKLDFWPLAMAFFVFAMSAIFVTRRREARLMAGRTDRNLETSVGAVLFCGVPIAVGAASATFAMSLGGLARFWAMVLAALVLSALATLLFETLMRWAARTPPINGFFGGRSAAATGRRELVMTVARATTLYGVSCFVAAFVLYWIGQTLIVRGIPTELARDADSYLARVVEGYTGKSEQAGRVDDKFANVPPQVFRMLRVDVRNAMTATDKTGDASANNIIRDCDALNGNMKGLLLEDCRLNGDFTRELGESTWLDNLRGAMLRVEALVLSLKRLRDYDTFHSALKSDWLRALIVASVWALLGTVFAASVVVSRHAILWENVDRKVVAEYERDFDEAAAVWLRTPVFDLGNLTPLEAIRYNDLRASFSDYVSSLKGQKPAVELKEVA
jgi:hypothetical protein